MASFTASMIARVGDEGARGGPSERTYAYEDAAARLLEWAPRKRYSIVAKYLEDRYSIGMDDEDRDYLAEEAVAAVDWEAGGKVHNWRNYVGKHVRALWATLSDTQKVAIVRDADELASGEHWD